MQKYFHSVTLDSDKCMGCINCIKRCPTEAIRVRHGKAKIIKERCIDCGECIKVCPYGAKKAVTDPLDIINNFKYKIALPAPTLYGQFAKVNDINVILTALKKLGFDDVFEVARGAEIVTLATKDMILQKKVKFPIISTACPAVVRLIRVRFPSLIDNLLPIASPMEVSAKIARQQAAKKTGLKPEEIGTFFISPCAAKMTVVKDPLGAEDTNVSGVISIKDIYVKLLQAIQDVETPENLALAGSKGVSWALSGGEAMAINDDEYVSVHGIENVIAVLEGLEEDKFKDLKFVEAGSCIGGCVGGPLTIENSFLADTRIKRMMRGLTSYKMETDLPDIELEDVLWDKKIEYSPVMKLDENMIIAMKKMEEMDNIYENLPRLDCGSCGAPSCRALAEDIVRGMGNETDCIYKLREKIQSLAREMVQLEENMVNFRQPMQEDDVSE